LTLRDGTNEDIVEATGHDVGLVQTGLDDVHAGLALDVLDGCQGRSLGHPLPGHDEYGRRSFESLLLPPGRGHDEWVEFEGLGGEGDVEGRALTRANPHAVFTDELVAQPRQDDSVATLGEADSKQATLIRDLDVHVRQGSTCFRIGHPDQQVALLCARHRRDEDHEGSEGEQAPKTGPSHGGSFLVGSEVVRLSWNWPKLEVFRRVSQRNRSVPNTRF
jgi:hypothetical protein